MDPVDTQSTTTTTVVSCSTQLLNVVHVYVYSVGRLSGVETCWDAAIRSSAEANTRASVRGAMAEDELIKGESVESGTLENQTNAIGTGQLFLLASVSRSVERYL